MKPGRNDPCPCGSGQKYKKCCAAKDEEANKAAFVAQAAAESAAQAEAEVAARTTPSPTAVKGTVARPAPKPVRAPPAPARPTMRKHAV